MELTSIKTAQGQSLWDIAIQEYGSADGIKYLLKDNPDLSIDDYLVPGYELKTRTQTPDDLNDKLRKEIKRENVMPNIGEKDSPGIGEMEIETDLIVK